MSLFTSDRERRLWLWTLAVVVAIYATLGLAKTLAGALAASGLVENAIWWAMFLMGAAILMLGMKTRLGGAEIGAGLGVLGAYFLLLLRMTLPEERSHMIEYSMVGALIFHALIERHNNGRRVPSPVFLAIGLTALLGWIDEGLQLLLPGRFYDLRDVGFNALAGLMAVVASLFLARVQRRFC